MSDERRKRERELADAIERRQRRKIRKRERGDDSLWFGLGMFGLVGWSVAIPILLGLGLGLFLDRRFATERSWTLMLLGAGVILGGINAGYWVRREREKMEEYKQKESNHE